MNSDVIIVPLVRTQSSLCGLLYEREAYAANPRRDSLAYVSLHFRNEGFTDASITVVPDQFATTTTREELFRVLYTLLLENRFPPLRAGVFMHAESRLQVLLEGEGDLERAQRPPDGRPRSFGIVREFFAASSARERLTVEGEADLASVDVHQVSPDVTYAHVAVLGERMQTADDAAWVVAAYDYVAFVSEPSPQRVNRRSYQVSVARDTMRIALREPPGNRPSGDSGMPSAGIFGEP